MTAQEKTEHIREAAMTEARDEADQIVQEHRDAMEKLFEQHKQEQQAQAQSQIEAEKSSRQQKLNMAISKAELMQKRSNGQTITKLKNDLFKEVEDLLEKYMQTDDYKDLLVKYITEATDYAKGADMTIYINPTDADKKDELEQKTGVTLTVSEEDFTGGMRAVIREKNILIDHAFKSAFEQQRQTFMFKGGAEDDG